MSLISRANYYKADVGACCSTKTLFKRVKALILRELARCTNALIKLLLLCFELSLPFLLPQTLDSYTYAHKAMNHSHLAPASLFKHSSSGRSILPCCLSFLIYFCFFFALSSNTFNFTKLSTN